VNEPFWRRIECTLIDECGESPIDEATVRAIVAALGYREPMLEGRDGEFSVEVPAAVAQAVVANGVFERVVEVDGCRWEFIAERECS
jgi:hypothetical protein